MYIEIGVDAPITDQPAEALRLVREYERFSPGGARTAWGARLADKLRLRPLSQNNLLDPFSTTIIN
jgi:hypothetical protein